MSAQIEFTSQGFAVIFEQEGIRIRIPCKTYEQAEATVHAFNATYE